jgi:type I restriction enzyme S subunit
MGGPAIEPASDIDSSKLLIKESTLLVSKLNPRKKTICLAEPHTDYPTVASGEFVAIRSRSIDRRYAYYLWCSEKVTDRLSALVQSVTRSHARVNPADITKLPWKWPPLETQRRIARFLDEKTARIDGLIEKKRALLDRLAEKRQALITRAVTKGLDPTAPMKSSGIDWLGDIPEHWDYCSLGQKIKLQRGVDITQNERVDGPYPVVSSGGIEYFHDVSFCSGPGVLIGRKGSAGKLHFVESDFWPHDTTLYVREFRGNIPRFVWYLLHTLDLISFDTGSANPTVNRNRVHPMRTAWPRLEEQVKISEYLDQQSGQIDEVETGVVRSIQRLNEYRSALITAAVTGKLRMEDAAEPPELEEV